MEPLPTFKYHPDPIRSGSIEQSTTECQCCGRARGYIYTGPTYAVDDLDNCLCPWCIAGGLAHKKFDAMFVDDSIFPDDIPSNVLKEVTLRTPGYSSWQSEVWPTCCNDVTAFLAPVGITEIRADYPDLEYDVTKFIVDELKIYNNEALTMLKALNRDSGPTAYIFQCLHCQAFHVHVDFL
jgi:uncharacterized protein CbrC (UPF0167 family)